MFTLQPNTIGPSPLILRPLTESDLPSLHKSCYSDQPANILIATKKNSLASQAKGDRVHLVITHGSQILGAGQVGRYGRKAEIADVIIAEPVRRQGLGTFLIQSLIQIAQEKQWLPLEIGVHSDNLPALSLYRHLGFLPKHTISLNNGKAVTTNLV